MSDDFSDVIQKLKEKMTVEVESHGEFDNVRGEYQVLSIKILIDGVVICESETSL